MTERSYTDLEWLKAETEVRAECREPGFKISPIIDHGTWLYDCQLAWLEDDGTVVFHDIGGQGEPGWDPEKGHGSTWRLHRDNKLECIVEPGSSGRAMLMSPMKSPGTFGAYSNAVFLLGQLRPGRKGAHNTHAVFWVPPETGRVEHFAVCSDSGSLNDGKSGALVSPGWGADGSPEEGILFVTSMYNCTMYKVDSARRIWPWVVGDGEHGVPQFMPREVFRAPAAWEEYAGELVVCGVADHHFGSRAPMPGQAAKEETIVRYLVQETGPYEQPKLTPIEGGYPIPSSTRYGGIQVAPEGFGPFGGQGFKVTLGSVNLMQTTMMPEGTLPYDSQIIRIDENGQEHVFVDKVQSGYPGLLFQGDRLLLSRIGKSYSTGDFHYPDGSLYEITYTGS
jgi:hypothetical protein